MARISRKKINQQEEKKDFTAVKQKTGLYSRLSLEGERSEDSIETQIRIMQNYLQDNNAFEITEIYQDIGFTGRNQNRPQFIKMLEDIQSKKIDCVIVKDLSRLGRNYLEVGELIFRFFKLKNIRFISINDHYDSNEDTAGMKKLTLLFKNLMNQWYSEDLGKKIKSAHETKMRKGELLGAVPPYGYRFSEKKESGEIKKLVTAYETAEVVKLIFQLRIDGLTNNKIANYLNDNGFLTPCNHHYKLGIVKHKKYGNKMLWDNSGVGKILSNPVYVGDLVQKKYERKNNNVTELSLDERIIHHNNHDPIIDKADFDTVQKTLMADREKYAHNGKNKHSGNIFVSKICCKKCGKAMKRHNDIRRDKVLYHYVCTQCRRELAKNNTATPTLKFHELEEAVISLLNMERAKCLDVKKQLNETLASNTVQTKTIQLKAEIKKLETQIGNKENFIAKAYQDLADCLLNENEYNFAIQKFRQDIHGLEQKIETLKNNLNQFDYKNVKQNNWIVNYGNDEAFNTLDKNTIDTFIDKIEVEPDTNALHIYVKYNDEYKILLSCLEKVGECH